MRMTHRYLCGVTTMRMQSPMQLCVLKNCIKNISSWMMHNSLQIKENKTDFIIFCTRSHKLKKHTLQIGTNIMRLSKTIKILVVTFTMGCLSCEVYQVVLNAVHNQMPYGCLGRLQPLFYRCPELWIPSPLELL